MKKLAALFVFIACSAFAQTNAHVRVQWSYNPDELTPDMAFRVYESTNINGPQWICVATTPETNVDFSIYPGAHFFRVTVSNFWGESGFSNACFTPPTPQVINTLTIIRVP